MRQGFPLGMLLTPVTWKLPVWSRSRTEFWSVCASTTVPCIHTTDTVNRPLPLPSLRMLSSVFPLPAVHPFASLSWLDKTFTGGLLGFSPRVIDTFAAAILHPASLKQPDKNRKRKQNKTKKIRGHYFELSQSECRENNQPIPARILY